MATRDSITDTFDYGDLAALPEYQELCHKLSDFANETPEEMKFSEFLDFMRGLVAIAPFADRCEKCALRDEEYELTWPYAGTRTDGWLDGDYQCSHGHRWRCSYVIGEWMTPEEKERVPYREKVWITPPAIPAAKGNSRNIPQAVKIAVAVRDEGQCVYCGSTERLQYDHVIPWSKGGDSSVENIQLLCGSHNASKRDKMPDDRLRSL